jgi:hypothetical protein
MISVQNGAIFKGWVESVNDLKGYGVVVKGDKPDNYQRPMVNLYEMTSSNAVDLFESYFVFYRRDCPDRKLPQPDDKVAFTLGRVFDATIAIIQAHE